MRRLEKGDREGADGDGGGGRNGRGGLLRGWAACDSSREGGRGTRWVVKEGVLLGNNGQE